MYSAFGLGGYVLVCLYFIFGSAVRLGGGVALVLLPVPGHLASPLQTWPLQRGF